MSVAFTVASKSDVQRRAKISNWDSVRAALRDLPESQVLILDGKQFRAKTVRQALYKNTGGDYKVSVGTNADGDLVLERVPMDAVPQASN